VYLKNQLDEDFRFFCSGDLIVVLQQWREKLFFIQTNESKSEEILRMQLQSIREILIFLFGTKFESVMRRNISLAKRQVFSYYIDKYVKLSKEDYLPLINALRFDPDSREIGYYFNQGISAIYPTYPINMITALLFNNGRIVSRYSAPNSIKLEPETISLLQQFVNVEYEKVQNLTGSERFDSNT